MKKFYLLCLLFGSAYLSMAQTKFATSRSDSLYHLGMRYFKSTFTLPDIPKAKYYLQESAKGGHPLAMEWLGELYKNDSLIETSNDSAVYWLNASVIAGNTRAWLKLGRIYEKGMNYIPQDFVKSADCFYKGMLLGDKNCKNMVAYYFYKGLQRQNYDSAFVLFQELAITNRYPNAMYFLGLCYRNGYGTARNIDSARYWLTESANLKEKEAKGELSINTPENPVEPLIAPVKIQNFNEDSLYHRIKHNVLPQSLEGIYTGYAIRYDWSGKHIISISPLQTTLYKKGEKLSGIWIEGNDTATIGAVCTDSNLVFNNTQYRKTNHYTPSSSEPWQFKNATFQLLKMPDSIYITGSVQLYNLLRKEPGAPLYIHLSRQVTLADQKTNIVEENLHIVTVNPNPFHDKIRVQFVLTSCQKVTIRLLSILGQNISSENTGLLLPGTYTHWIDIPNTISSGPYLVSINTGNTSKQAIVIKQ